MLRTIRSFVRREGRLTPGQSRALEILFPLYGIQLEKKHICFSELFGNTNPCILEIGFGSGSSLLEQAKVNPHLNYLGIEVHSPGVGALLLGVEAEALKNIRVCCADAVSVLDDMIADASLAGVQIFFPDPWHKKRHNKRRLIQPLFVEKLKRTLQPGGFLHFATDWQHYAEWMRTVLDASSGLRNTSPTGGVIPRPSSRPYTKFEARGERLKHEVFDFYYRLDTLA